MHYLCLFFVGFLMMNLSGCFPAPQPHAVAPHHPAGPAVVVFHPCGGHPCPP